MAATTTEQMMAPEDAACPILASAPAELTYWEKRVWRRGVLEATQHNMPMTRDRAVNLARASALAHSGQHAYLPQTRAQADTWEPHAWVILAIQAAAIGAPVALGIDLAPVHVALTDVYVALSCINAGDDGSVDLAADALVRLRAAIFLIDASRKDYEVQDDRFPRGLVDAIEYADNMEEAAEGLYQHVFEHESDGEDCGTVILQRVLGYLKDSPKGGSDAAALRRALAEYPGKNTHQLQARKVCDGVAALALTYGAEAEATPKGGIDAEVALYQVRPRSFPTGEGWREVPERQFNDHGDFPGYPDAEWERRKLCVMQATSAEVP